MNGLAQHWNAITRQPERRRLALAGAGLLLAATMAGCSKGANAGAAGPGKGPAGPTGPMPVSAVRVEQRDVPLSGDWVGTLDGYVNAQIQPQVSGYLITQLYKEGSPVTKGQVLFNIDPRPFQAIVDQALGQVAQAQGQLAQAEAQLGLARINVNRDTPLAAQHAIAQSQLDNDKQQQAANEATVSAAKAQIASAQAAVETARLNLGFTHVRSLISGVAGQATTQVGNLVSPQSVLTAVSQLNPIKVYFSISDREYLALAQRAHAGGGDLLKGSANLPLTLTLANGTPYPEKGHIVFVDRQINPQTGAIRIAAAFPNANNLLRPGQFGRVSAETEIRHNALLVPQIAVQELQGLEQVYTISPKGTVHIAEVKLGPQVGNDWLIESGLAPGTQVITDNVQKLKEGVPVTPHAAPATTAPTATESSDSAGR